MSAYLQADEATRLYDAYRFGADDCVSVQNLVEEIVGVRVMAALNRGIRFGIYEVGAWCGECDPADPDDDCCVLPQRIREELDEVSA